MGPRKEALLPRGSLALERTPGQAGGSTATESELAAKCAIVEFKVKGLQAQVREFKDREEEREREQAEPWALRHRSAAAFSPSGVSEVGQGSASPARWRSLHVAACSFLCSLQV